MAVKLSTLVRGRGPMTPKQVEQARKWVVEDWESHDYDKELVDLVKRLIDTIQQDARLNRRP